MGAAWFGVQVPGTVRKLSIGMCVARAKKRIKRTGGALGEEEEEGKGKERKGKGEKEIRSDR